MTAVVRVAAVIEIDLIGHITRFTINTIMKTIYSVYSVEVVVFGGDRGGRLAVVIAERPGRRYKAHVVLVDEVFEQFVAFRITIAR